MTTPDMTDTYYANDLAGTLVNGVPSLTVDAALCVAAGIPLTNTGETAANVLAGNTTPATLLRKTGALNEAAGSTDLEDPAALKILAGA